MFKSPEINIQFLDHKRDGASFQKEFVAISDDRRKYSKIN